MPKRNSRTRQLIDIAHAKRARIACCSSSNTPADVITAEIDQASTSQQSAQQSSATGTTSDIFST